MVPQACPFHAVGGAEPHGLAASSGTEAGEAERNPGRRAEGLHRFGWVACAGALARASEPVLRFGTRAAQPECTGGFVL